MKVTAISAVILLAGCERGTYGEMDNQVVCSPDRKMAYYIEPGVGSTSFLRKAPHLIKVCEAMK